MIGAWFAFVQGSPVGAKFVVPVIPGVALRFTPGYLLSSHRDGETDVHIVNDDCHTGLLKGSVLPSPIRRELLGRAPRDDLVQGRLLVAVLPQDSPQPLNVLLHASGTR